jgi:hypothetical protein
LCGKSLDGFRGYRCLGGVRVLQIVKVQTGYRHQAGGTARPPADCDGPRGGGSPRDSPRGISCAATFCACPRARRLPALRKKPQGVRVVPVLTRQQVKEGTASGGQVQVFEGAGFLERTPLWYYVPAEAATLGQTSKRAEVQYHSTTL